MLNSAPKSFIVMHATHQLHLLRTIIGPLLTVVGAASCAQVGLRSHPSPRDADVGILVMAHGGGPEWNAAVEEAVAPVRAFAPAVVAFGMAERSSLQEAVDSLETLGATRIAVVRLFVSGESFRSRTEYLFGLRRDPAGDSTSGALVTRHATFVMSQEGLADYAGSGEILAERVRALSKSPESESVLILAHGMRDDAANAALVSRIEGLAEAVRRSATYREVRVETLREDWEAKRHVAEERVRTFVRGGSRDGGRVIVVPFRLFGFGPYREVLDGLSYVADEEGLLPHPKITEWIKAQAVEAFSRSQRD